MEFKDLEELLYHLYCNSELERILSIVRKEFLNGNREIFIWTFLSDAYCSIEKFKKRGKILSKIALNLINEKLKKEETEKLLFYSALINVNLGNYKESISYYNKIIVLNHNNITYLVDRARIQYLIGNYYDSINDFTKAIELNPNNENYYYQRGCAKSWLKDHKGELEDQTKAIELNPNKPEYYYRKHCALMGLGRQDEAREYLEKANALGYKETF